MGFLEGVWLVFWLGCSARWFLVRLLERFLIGIGLGCQLVHRLVCWVLEMTIAWLGNSAGIVPPKFRFPYSRLFFVK
jgi:hypothetical protein